MKKSYLSFLFILWVYSQPMFGQDFIYSQYFGSQSYINPALTGFFDGDYKFSSVYRSQWSAYGTNFQTLSVNAEGSFFKEKLNGSYLSLGLSGYRDDMASTVTNDMGRLNASFTKKIGDLVPSFLSFGTYIGMSSLNLNSKFFITPDDITESLARRSIQNFDMGVGLNYQIVFPSTSSIFIGAAISHVLPMRVSYLNNSVLKEKLLNVYTSARIKAGERVNFIPSVLFSYQNPNKQLNAGTNVQFYFGDYAENNSSIQFGSFIRFGNNAFDAWIFQSRMDYRGLSIGASFDVNMNDMKIVTNGFGAWEISIAYTGLLKTNKKTRLDCPSYKNF
jgi:type IX secretion system PorP/SprF family membrane protein